VLTKDYTAMQLLDKTRHQLEKTGEILESSKALVSGAQRASTGIASLEQTMKFDRPMMISGTTS